MLEWAGIGLNGLERAGMDYSRLELAGMGLNLLGLAGINWNGLEMVRPSSNRCYSVRVALLNDIYHYNLFGRLFEYKAF